MPTGIRPSWIYCLCKDVDKLTVICLVLVLQLPRQKNKIKILRSDTEIDAAKGKETTPTLLQAKEKIPNSPQFQPSYWNPTGG